MSLEHIARDFADTLSYSTRIPMVLVVALINSGPSVYSMMKKTGGMKEKTRKKNATCLL